MPEKPKSVGGRQMVRFLQRRGWRVERIHGSHHIVATLQAGAISTEEFNKEA